jgi:hypothetical protein
MCTNCSPYRATEIADQRFTSAEGSLSRRGTLALDLHIPISRAQLLKTMGGGLAAAMTAGALSWEFTRSSAKPFPYVVLIVLDGARSEYFNVSGIPHVRSLMRNGTQYTNAFAGILESETPSGHVSIATGSEPRITGVPSFWWATSQNIRVSLFNPTNIRAGDMENTMCWAILIRPSSSLTAFWMTAWTRMPCSRCRTGRCTDNDGNPEQSRAQSVALPALGLTLSTASSPQVPPAIRRQFRMIVSRTRAPGVAFKVVERLGADVIEMGSAEAKTTAVVGGQADIHLCVGGQHEWVSAAPIAVALVSGLHVSRLDGSALRYNQAEAWPPDQLVYQLELAPRVVGTRAACQ